MVGAGGIEPPTSSVSRRRSTTEPRAYVKAKPEGYQGDARVSTIPGRACTTHETSARRLARRFESKAGCHLHQRRRPMRMSSRRLFLNGLVACSLLALPSCGDRAVGGPFRRPHPPDGHQPPRREQQPYPEPDLRHQCREGDVGPAPRQLHGRSRKQPGSAVHRHVLTGRRPIRARLPRRARAVNARDHAGRCRGRARTTSPPNPRRRTSGRGRPARGSGRRPRSPCSARRAGSRGRSA